jgi:hypothetical protein
MSHSLPHCKTQEHDEIIQKSLLTGYSPENSCPHYAMCKAFVLIKEQEKQIEDLKQRIESLELSRSLQPLF